MKTLFKFSLALAVAVLAFSLQPSAFSQVTPTRVQSAVVTNNILCALTTTNLVSGNLVTNQVKLGRHVGIGVVFCGGASTNTGTVGLQFNVMFGGTNSVKSTTKVVTATYTANGTTAVSDWYVLPDYTLGPVDGLVLTAITNAAVNVNPAAAGCLTVSNIWLQTLP